MQIKYILILKMFILIEGYILYDYGSNEQIVYTNGFSCDDVSTTTKTVTFSGTF